MAADGFEACTIVARNYLAHASVLAESLAAHHRGARLQVLVIDARDAPPEAPSEHVQIVTARDIGFDSADYSRLAAIYDAKELSTAVKPMLLRRLLAQGASAAVYFDPDIEIFAPLDGLAGLAHEDDIVLTPHTLAPIPRDGLKPSDREILAAGIYNLGFIAVGPRARPFLDWWDVRLRRDCVVAVEQGLFVDQRWIDFVPALFRHRILRDKTMNVAFWNLHERDLTFDGVYRVDGKPLRFFHFSGFDPRRPHVLTSHWPPQHTAPRITVGRSSALAQICREYASSLLANGYASSISTPYAFTRAASGREVERGIRRRFREELLEFEAGDGEEPPDPFDPAAAEAFERWCGDTGAAEKPLDRAIELVTGARTAVTPSRRGRIGDVYRRTVLAGLRHYRHYQQEISVALIQAAQEQDQALADLRRRVDESVPYMSDPGALRTTDEYGRNAIGFRNGRAARAGGGLYIGFEGLFRGPEQLVSDRQRFYLPLVVESAPIVDIGCGRGEMLDLLAEAGIEARGVDADAEMVAHCRAKGHHVELADAVDFLERQADGSIGTIFSAQVVEHLGFESLLRVLAVAVRKLRPCGLLVAETVNPHSLPAFRTFWVDPSHVGPLFPETLVALCRETGFAEAFIVFPLGEGDLETDLRDAGEYAVVARTSEQP